MGKAGLSGKTCVDTSKPFKTVRTAPVSAEIRYVNPLGVAGNYMADLSLAVYNYGCLAACSL